LLRPFTNASVHRARTKWVTIVDFWARTDGRTRGADEQDYLYGLAESVRELYPLVRDDYLFALEVGVSCNIFTGVVN
jgi:hypothetical protein